MRRLDKQITDKQIIDEILHKSEICRLGLIDTNEVYIVPVNFAYSDGIIYIHSAHDGRKMNLMKANKHVSFEIELHHEISKSESPCGWTTNYRSVMGKGTITIENSPTMKKIGLDFIMQKYGADMELIYNENVLARMTLILLKIDEITGKQSGDWE